MTLEFHPPEFNAVSAKFAVPVILEHLLPMPNTILDLGCNIGTWLREFKVCLPHATVHGVDGDNMREHLVIEPQEFTAGDLSEPIALSSNADLVLCLETGEHLPIAAAPTLVANCIAHADRFIAFSAARPGQGGYKHINEQPMSYWKLLFASQGWFPIHAGRLPFPRMVFEYHARMVILKRD